MCYSVDEIERRDGAQNRINEAAFDQNWLVYGPAGTGKTIIALARLERLCRLLPNEQHVLISKSKLLNRWVELSAARMDLSARVRTFDQFVWNHVKGIIDDEPDKVDPTKGWDEIDWTKTIPKLRDAYQRKPERSKLSLILDEAQDVRPGFFEACKIMCSRVFILMDENQKTEVFADTKRSFIAQTLGIDEKHQQYLGINYRNPEAIKRLSEVFFDGDESELADLAPEEVRPVLESPPTIRWLSFDSPESPSDQIRHVLAYCRDRPQSTICVVAPRADRVKPIAKALRSGRAAFPTLKKLDNWTIQEYVSKTWERCNLNLCRPGIVVSTALNLKGSEYSAVFLAEWEQSDNHDPAHYTVITRAKARLDVLADPSEQARGKVRAMFGDALDAGLISEIS